MNEGACDPDGRFYCGSMAYDRRPGAGTLYRLDPTGRSTSCSTGLTISNGLDWAPTAPSPTSTTPRPTASTSSTTTPPPG